MNELHSFISSKIEEFELVHYNVLANHMIVITHLGVCWHKVWVCSSRRVFDSPQIYLVHVCCGLVRVPQEIKQHVGTLVRTKQEKKKHPYDSSFLHLRIKTVVTCMEMQGGKCYSLQFGDVIPQIVVVFFVTFYAFDVYCCSWVGLCYVGCLEWPP